MQDGSKKVDRRWTKLSYPDAPTAPKRRRVDWRIGEAEKWIEAARKAGLVDDQACDDPSPAPPGIDADITKEREIMPTEENGTEHTRTRAKYPGYCSRCQSGYPAGTDIWMPELGAAWSHWDCRYPDGVSPFLEKKDMTT